MILVECKPDMALVNCLGVSMKEIIHCGNKSRICKRLERTRGQIGLVDEDPYSAQPPYISKLKIINNKSGFKILYDPRRNNYLIILSPRLEEWILRAAKEAGVNVKKYGLPPGGDDLHRVVNLRIDKFRELVSDLRSKSRIVRELEKTLKQVLLDR